MLCFHTYLISLGLHKRNSYTTWNTFLFHYCVHSPADIAYASPAFWILSFTLAASRLFFRNNPFLDCRFTVLLHICFNVRECIIKTVANKFFHLFLMLFYWLYIEPMRLIIVVQVSSLRSDPLHWDILFSRHHSLSYLRTLFQYLAHLLERMVIPESWSVSPLQ